jgi:8-amino-7-oxononanoate synthase
VLDDTQALWILGRRPRRGAPYGERGGGTLAWAGVGGSDVVAVSSLAKAFGAPVAVVAGSSDVLGRLASRSETIVYSSAPSFADLHAAERALEVNRTTGDRLRRRLTTLVRRLRRRVGEHGLSLVGGSFPVQALATPDLDGAWAVHRTLLGQGVHTVVQRPRCRRGAYVTLIVTARHRLSEIDRAAAALARAVPGQSSQVPASSSPPSPVTTAG